MSPIEKTSSAWAQANPILAYGQKGIETDTGREKVGDGVSSWAPLNYLGSGGSSGGVTLGPRYGLEFNSTHELYENSNWNVAWTGSMDADVSGLSPYPGSIQANLVAFPPGLYSFFLGVTINTPLPRDLKLTATLKSSAVLGDYAYQSPVIDSYRPKVMDYVEVVGSGTFIVPGDADSSTGVTVQIRSTKVDPEDVNVDPFVIGYAFLYVDLVSELS